MAAIDTAEKGLKVTTVSERKHYRTVTTEYFNTGFERLDHSIICPERTVCSTYIRDLAHARMLMWCSDRPEYMIMSTDGSPAEPKPSVSVEGEPELIIDIKTTDTGERKTFWGQLARHLITEETRRWAPGAVRRGSDTKSILDGWYVDAEILPASKQHPVTCVLFIGHEAPRMQTNHSGPSPSGVAMCLRQVFVHQMEDGSNFVTDETVTGVTEWVEGPLPDELFQPPAGYTLVETLTQGS
jgi:hypothetical protein